MVLVYKLISPSNKIYIGITINTFESHLRTHKYSSKYRQTKIAKAIKKYGLENFKKEILEDNLSLEVARIRESALIKQFNSYHKVYNSTSGGEGERESHREFKWEYIEESIINHLKEKGLKYEISFIK